MTPWQFRELVARALAFLPSSILGAAWRRSIERKGGNIPRERVA